MTPAPTLAVEFLGRTLENPFLLSAGPSTDDLDMARAGLEAGWAGLVLKTTTVEGTPVRLAYPLMAGLEWGGRLVGLGNIDLISVHPVTEVERRVGILVREFPSKFIVASIMGTDKESWQVLVRRLADAGAHAVECSFSCPQGSMGEKPGAMLAQSPSATERVTSWVKEAAGSLPVLIKITPQVSDVGEIARAVRNGGADAITASNSVPALMGIDIHRFSPLPSVGSQGTYAGLTGPAIKPITLRTIAEIARHVSLPISGNGGITTWVDAVEAMAVGAATVQICSAVMMEGFGIIDDLCGGLARYLARHGFSSPAQVVGRALPSLVDHHCLPRHRVRSQIDLTACVRCGRCVVSCRDAGHGALTMDLQRAPQVDHERCVGCGLCQVVCPVRCVRMEVVG